MFGGEFSIDGIIADVRQLGQSSSRAIGMSSRDFQDVVVRRTVNNTCQDVSRAIGMSCHCLSDNRLRIFGQMCERLR